MPTSARPRVDLDGLTLSDPRNPGGEPIAVLRYRTTRGLVLLIPESADFLVDWENVESVSLDLKSGRLHLAFAEAYQPGWLRGARTLEGAWTDRCELRAESLGL